MLCPFQVIFIFVPDHGDINSVLCYHSFESYVKGDHVSLIMHITSRIFVRLCLPIIGIN